MDKYDIDTVDILGKFQHGFCENYSRITIVLEFSEGFGSLLMRVT